MTPSALPWPHMSGVATVTLDYSRDTPGLFEVDHLTATCNGVPLPITRQPSSVIPGGWSITYPCEEAMLAHVYAMQAYRLKLAAVGKGDETVTTDDTPPTVERLVFNTRMTPSAARRMAAQAETRQEKMI